MTVSDGLDCITFCITGEPGRNGFPGQNGDIGLQGMCIFIQVVSILISSCNGFPLNIRKAKKVNAERMVLVELDHLVHLDLKYVQINLKFCQQPII